MLRTYAPALILLVFCVSTGCGRSRKPIGEESGLRSGAGGVGAVGGRPGSMSGGARAGAGGRPATGTGGAGVAGGIPAGTGGNSSAGVAGGTAGAFPGAGAGGFAGGGFAGATPGFAGMGGGFAGMTAGFGGGGFSGGGFSGGDAGAAGAFEPQTCVWWSGFCGYPDGSQCSSFTCCQLDGDRCCDGTGRCSEPIPPPPEWVPPITAGDIGEPGWKTSTKPLCPGAGEAQVGSIWSDSRGVFVTSTVFDDRETDADNTCFGCPLAIVQHNDGTGWRTVETPTVYGQRRLKGFDNGALVLFGQAETRMVSGQPCGIALLSGSMLSCEAVEGATDVAVSGTTAYAALQGDLVRYDGTSWGPVPVVFPGQRELNALWANQDVVVGTGMSAGKIFSLRNNTWTIENTRTLETFISVFGLSSTDIWAGTTMEHLFHYDGTEWKQVAWPGSGCTQGYTGIHSIWGKDGIVYFATGTALARWNGTSVERIAQWDCANASAMVTGLWGNSPTELFVLMSDFNQTRQPCGTQFVFHYDGSKFHRM